MQIGHLHKNTYKLYALVLPEESKSEFIKEAEKLVEHWEILHKQRVSDKIKQKVIGTSRATYYRRKKLLQTGIIKSKRPKNVRKTKFTSETYELIRQVRTEHKTYGKAKIAAILKRDHSIEISESSVGRILEKFKFPKSLSCPRYRRKIKFMSYAKRREFKLYSQMEIGGKLQIDRMVRTINGLACRVFVACDKKSNGHMLNHFLKLVVRMQLNS